jgi:hypothetical protein
MSGRKGIPLVAKALLAAVLAVPAVSIAVVATPGVASAAGHGAFTQSASCGTIPNCYMIPTPAQWPGGVDASGGATDQSSQLMWWLWNLATNYPHTAANPMTIMLQPGGVYHSDFTLRLANKYQASDQMWPGWPAYDLEYTTIDLNGSTIEQRVWDGSYYRSNPGGDPIISTGGVSNVTVTNGMLQNTAFNATHTRGPSVEDWHGIRVGGLDSGHPSEHLDFTNLTIKKTGGDFAEITSAVDDITFENNILLNPGRHGFTFNQGTHLNFINNEIHDGRFAFDSEPGGGLKEIGWVTVAFNYAEGASQGFFQTLIGQPTNIHDIYIGGNWIFGVPGVLLQSTYVPRQNFTFEWNTMGCWARNPPNFSHPVNTTGWYGVNVSNNTFNVKYAANQLAWNNRFPQIDPYVGGPPTNPITTPNTYVQC